MFGGGEEYFAEPKPVDKDTLYNLATLNAKLRAAEKIGKKTVEDLVETCELVGQGSLANKELVIGCLFRHIKFWPAGGKKKLLCWYVLDKVVKRGLDTYGYLAGQYVQEVGMEHIPWEDEKDKKEYHKLLESWDGVFPESVIKTIFNSRTEHLKDLENPKEAKEILEEEEKVWKREEAKHQEEDGLDDYAEPCINFLQGNCAWGDGCTQLHPKGQEGTLPPECRLGDWRCSGCGTINRHFRRRCFSCPREKPQYKKGKNQESKDVLLLSNPDTAGTEIFKKQFGYDPCNESEALQFWQDKFSGSGAGMTVTQWRLERSAAIRTKILKKVPNTEMEQSVLSRVNWESTTDPEWHKLQKMAQENDAFVEGEINMEKNGRPKKRRKLEYQAELPRIDPMPARDRVYFIVFRILDQGMEHREAAGYCYLLSVALQDAVKDPQFGTPPSDQALHAVVDCFKMVYVHWNAKGKPPQGHVAPPLFAEVKKCLSVIPFTQTSQREEVTQYCKLVVG